MVQDVWQRVAEDYAPFDVDVTTEDPGLAALERSDSGDTTYGVRVLISPRSNASFVICDDLCDGVAHLASFNYYQPAPGWVHSEYYEPAWVFPHMLANNPKYIAEAASHEAGHNLNLEHDGTSTAGYYEGHGNWAPIMGAGYYEPIVQWSTGEYDDANNPQDDLAIMQSYGAPLRPDDHGDAASPTLLARDSDAATGTISARTNVDAFAFSTAGGGSPSRRTPRRSVPTSTST